MGARWQDPQAPRYQVPAHWNANHPSVRGWQDRQSRTLTDEAFTVAGAHDSVGQAGALIGDSAPADLAAAKASPRQDPETL